MCTPGYTGNSTSCSEALRGLLSIRVSPLYVKPGSLAGGDDGGGSGRSEESWEGRECREGGN